MTFAQGAQQHGVPMLREAVRTAQQTFKDYLLDLHGDSLKFSKEVALSHLTEKVCYPILRNQHVAAIFGVTKIAHVDYPYTTDPQRDLLVEQIDQLLTWPTDNTQAYGKLTRERISNLQKVALRGAEALATILDFDAADSDSDLDHLITKCHVWGTALSSVRSGTRPPSTQPVSASLTATTPASRVASR